MVNVAFDPAGRGDVKQSTPRSALSSRDREVPTCVVLRVSEYNDASSNFRSAELKTMVELSFLTSRLSKFVKDLQRTTRAMDILYLHHTLEH